VSRINLRTTVAYHATKDIGQTSALLNPALHRSKGLAAGYAIGKAQHKLAIAYSGLDASSLRRLHVQVQLR
jgi:hypothetical protein